SEILEKNLSIVSNYKQCEIFVIDDGSRSEEAYKNKLMCQRFKCNYKYTSNHGPSHARHVGLLLSKTDYCFFLDSDDYVSELALNYGVDYLLSNKNIDAVVFKSEYVKDLIPFTFDEIKDNCIIKRYKKGFVRECIECMGYPKMLTIGWNQSNTLYRTNKLINFYNVRYLTWGEDIPLKLSLSSGINFVSINMPHASQIKISYGRGYKYTFKQIFELAFEIFKTSKRYYALFLSFLIIIRYTPSYIYKKIK
ncbi:glycosyltransferase, partial [Salmonella enterica]|nr:glycosyltransferase [Salmonella enterica]